MTISIVIDFHAIMHNHLTHNQELASKLKGILYSPQNYNKYPHIFHKIISIKSDNHSLKTYEIEGEINLFTREVANEEIKQILGLIEDIVVNIPANVRQFKCISAKVVYIEFMNSADEITSKARLQYFALIQRYETEDPHYLQEKIYAA